MQVIAPGIHLYTFDKAKECLELVDKPELYKKGFVDYGRGNKRPSRVTSILNPVMLGSSSPDISQALEVFDKDLLHIVDLYRQEFFLEELVKETGWLLMKYDVGDYFDLHKDEDPHYDRTVSLVAYLNDGYTGGEIEFPDFGVSVAPKAGDVLVFPGSFAYRHLVKPVTSGTRYCVVNWFRFLNR